MLRKTFITLTAVVGLGLASTAMAAMGGGGHGGGGGGGMGGGSHGGGGMMGGGGMGHGGSFGAAGLAAMPKGGAGPMMRGGNIGPMTRGGPITTAPMAGGRIQNWGGRTAWRFHDHFHDHFRHRFHHHNFFAFGFGVPFYDYAYDSCWSWVPTRYGWRWAYVCGDYGYY